MNYRKISILSFITAFFTMLFSQVVMAAPLDTFKKIITMQFLTDLLGPGTGAIVDPLEGVVRFLVLVLLFTLFYKGAELLKLGRNISIVVSLVISLISVIFIPGSIIIAAATSYGVLVSALLLGVPVAILFVGYWIFKESHWVRFALMTLMAMILGQMKTHLTALAGGANFGIAGTGTGVAPTVTPSSIAAAFTPVINSIDYVFWLAVILAFFSFLKALPSSDPDTTQGFWDRHIKPRIADKTNELVDKHLPSKEKREEEKAAKQEKIAALNEYVEEEKELKLIKKANTDRNKLFRLVGPILAGPRFKYDKIKSELDTFEHSIEKCGTEIRRLKSRTFRQEKKAKVLIDFLDAHQSEYKLNASDIRLLNAMEASILTKHQELINKIEEIEAFVDSGVCGDNLDKLKSVAADQTLGSSVAGETIKVRLELLGSHFNRGGPVRALLIEASNLSQESITLVEGIIVKFKQHLKL